MSANRSVGRSASAPVRHAPAPPRPVLSRGELISWVNNLLQVNLTKVEQCANGSIYCQIIDACHPNTVAMQRVNWVAKLDHEIIPNYTLLQKAFQKNSIEDVFYVGKLIQAKYKDNLEFLQFLKCYWELCHGCRHWARAFGYKSLNYKPCHAREGKALPAWCQRARGAASGGAMREKENVTPKAATVKAGPAPEQRLGSIGRPATALGTTVKATGGPKTPRPQNNSFVSDGSVALDTSAPKGRSSADLGLQAENKRLKEENQEFRATLDGLAKERDYYFRKLRLVEMFCTQQVAQEDPAGTPEKVLNDITGILYAEGSDEDEPEEQAA